MTVARLAILGIVFLTAVVAAEWAGFSYSRTAGELSLLALPVAAWILSWFIGAGSSSNRLLATLVAFGVGVSLCYANYAFLYWLRVMHLREIDAGLFHYFGSVYGGGIQITALFCGVLAFVGASVARKRKPAEHDRSRLTGG